MRATSRIADVSINTVTKLLESVGRACAKFHNDHVVNLTCKTVQTDEIWSFVYSKEKNVPEGMEDSAGDIWTWTAIDADSKLIISYAIGGRDAETGREFMNDVASRINNRIQLTSDGWHVYLEAVSDAFGHDIDFAQLVKVYGGGSDSSNPTERKYSPTKLKSAIKTPVFGNPDEALISTSYVERCNLTMRMHMRRFTRLTNAFSKKIENHYHAIALHFMYYNFVKQHKSLRITPAMAAGITKRFMTLEDIANLVKYEVPKKRGDYKKRTV